MNDAKKVRFSDLAYKKLSLTTKVASYYIDGLDGRPKLGRGLDIIGRKSSYHLWEMAPEMADEFVRRVTEFWAKIIGKEMDNGKKNCCVS